MQKIERASTHQKIRESKYTNELSPIQTLEYMDTDKYEREWISKYYGMARAHTSRQAHLRLHNMRVPGPVGPHYLGVERKRRNVDGMELK